MGKNPQTIGSQVTPIPKQWLPESEPPTTKESRIYNSFFPPRPEAWFSTSMSNSDGMFYSLQLRLVKDSSNPGVELIALPEGPGEPRRARFEQWEPLSARLTAVASSTPFHLKVIYRTIDAGLTASLIDRSTGARQIFSLNQLEALGLAS